MLPHLCAILTVVVLAVLAALDVALFAYYVWATFIGQPYWDMFSIVQRYLQYRADGNLWSYLWEPHVQHRMVWMRILTSLDASLLSGRGYPFAVFAVLCQGLTAWLLARAVRRRIPGTPGAWLSWVALMLVLTSVAAVDCALPINGIYPQALIDLVGGQVNMMFSELATALPHIQSGKLRALGISPLEVAGAINALGKVGLMLNVHQDNLQAVHGFYAWRNQRIYRSPHLAVIRDSR